MPVVAGSVLVVAGLARALPTRPPAGGSRGKNEAAKDAALHERLLRDHARQAGGRGLIYACLPACARHWGGGKQFAS